MNIISINTETSGAKPETKAEAFTIVLVHRIDAQHVGIYTEDEKYFVLNQDLLNRLATA